MCFELFSIFIISWNTTDNEDHDTEKTEVKLEQG